MVILITGKAGAGKTHYADALVRELKTEGKEAVKIDGDDLRLEQGNTKFDDTGRMRNLTYAAELAARYEKRGVIAVLSFIAPKREWRDMMRAKWKESRVVYIPGGYLWEGTEYEKPTDDELNIRIFKT